MPFLYIVLYSKQNHNRKGIMASVSKNQAKIKKEKKTQKIARQIQRNIRKRNKTKCVGKRLTGEEKEIRCSKLAACRERKRQHRREQQEKYNAKRFQKSILKIFNVEGLDLLARSTGFIKRKGLITAFAFIYSVSFGFLGNGEIALIYLVAGLAKNFDIFVTAQALSKRINSSSSPKFLKKVFQQLLGAQIETGLKNHTSEVFHMFDHILLQDSTQIALNELLSDDFTAPGGGGSTSGLKLDFVYDILNSFVCGVKMTCATVNDQSLSKEIVKYLKGSTLVIRDLGYFSLKCLKLIDAKGCFYLSRLSITAYAYLDEKSKEPLNLLEHFKKNIDTENKIINFDVYVGKEERVKTRLIAQKLPKDVKAQRTARYKREKKKEPDPYYTEWCGYAIFITNIPIDMLSDDFIITLYKIRWQIELVFKSFKSNIEIDYMKGTNKNRIECLVYGRLITLTMTFIIHNYVATIAEKNEVSGDKLVKYLMSDHRLREAIIQNDLSQLLSDLEYRILQLCKQKRARKTTFDNLEEVVKNSLINLSSLKGNGDVLMNVFDLQNAM